MNKAPAPEKRIVEKLLSFLNKIKLERVCLYYFLQQFVYIYFLGVLFSICFPLPTTMRNVHLWETSDNNNNKKLWEKHEC